MKITHRTWQRYNAILKALVTPTTSSELAKVANMGYSSIGSVINNMLKQGYITKAPNGKYARRFVYTRTITEVPMSVVLEDGIEYIEAGTTNHYVRTVKFDSEDMQEKLIAQAKQLSKERKHAPAHINSSWGIV